MGPKNVSPEKCLGTHVNPFLCAIYSRCNVLNKLSSCAIGKATENVPQ